MNKDKKTLVISFLVLGAAAGMVVLGGYIKYAGAVPGSETGLGSAAGQALYNTHILYDASPSYYDDEGPFHTAGIMGPFVGTISGLNSIAGWTGTIAYGHFYYGYDWCSAYPGSTDCSGNSMPLCLILWTPIEGGGDSDQTYRSCYSYGGGSTKAWRAADDGAADSNDRGLSQVLNLQVITAQPGKTGLAEIDDR